MISFNTLQYGSTREKKKYPRCRNDCDTNTIGTLSAWITRVVEITSKVQFSHVVGTRNSVAVASSRPNSRFLIPILMQPCEDPATIALPRFVPGGSVLHKVCMPYLFTLVHCNDNEQDHATVRLDFAVSSLMAMFSQRDAPVISIPKRYQAPLSQPNRDACWVDLHLWLKSDISMRQGP